MLKCAKCQPTGKGFYWEQNEHRQPVEEIVDGGASECAAEVRLAGDLPQGDDGVRDGCSDVRTHDNWYGVSYSEN